MLVYQYCVRFNEMEIGSIFDFRVAVGVFYQVVHITPKLVFYKPLNAPSGFAPICEYVTAIGVVGLYEIRQVEVSTVSVRPLIARKLVRKKEVFNG